MRRKPLPLENWPAPQLDDEAVDSAIAAMDLQSTAGYKMLDVWGLVATYGWPPDIISAVDKDRRKRIHKLLAAAKQRRILLTLGMGTYSWGYDKICNRTGQACGLHLRPGARRLSHRRGGAT